MVCLFREVAEMRSLSRECPMAHKKMGLAFLLRPCLVGADGRIRTADLLITNQLLYQLSYIGTLNFEV